MPNANSFLRAIHTIYLMLFIFQTVILAFGSFVVFTEGTVLVDFGIPVIIPGCLAIAGFLAGTLIFKKKTESLAIADKNLDEKLAGYQSALISRYALLEFPMFYSLFLFMGNGDYRYLLISITVLAVHLFLRPTKDNVCQTLNLTDLQRSEL